MSCRLWLGRQTHGNRRVGMFQRQRPAILRDQSLAFMATQAGDVFPGARPNPALLLVNDFPFRAQQFETDGLVGRDFKIKGAVALHRSFAETSFGVVVGLQGDDPDLRNMARQAAARRIG